MVGGSCRQLVQRGSRSDSDAGAASGPIMQQQQGDRYPVPGSGPISMSGTAWPGTGLLEAQMGATEMRMPVAPPPPTSLTFVLVKPALISTHASHFAGGKHAFLCMASTLAACGHKVHVVCASSKASLMVAAMQGAPMAPHLTALSVTPAHARTAPGASHPTHHPHALRPVTCPMAVATWRCHVHRQKQQQQQHKPQPQAGDPGPGTSHPLPATPPSTDSQQEGGEHTPSIQFHAVLTDQDTDQLPGGSGQTLPSTSWQQAMAVLVGGLAGSADTTTTTTQTWVIVDADDCQLQPAQTNRHAAPNSTTPPAADHPSSIAVTSHPTHLPPNHPTSTVDDGGLSNGVTGGHESDSAPTTMSKVTAAPPEAVTQRVLCSSCASQQPPATNPLASMAPTSSPTEATAAPPSTAAGGGSAVLPRDHNRECSSTSTSTSSSRGVGQVRAVSLFELLVAAVPAQRVVALVQNVHFLPCGPSGTSQRTPALMQAWSALAGVLCVSHFVRDYLATHLPQDLTASSALEAPTLQHQPHSSPQPSSMMEPTGGQGCGGTSRNGMPAMHVTRLNAWGCFGQAPFQDCSGQALQQLNLWQQQQDQQQPEQQQQSGQQLPAPPAAISQAHASPPAAPTAAGLPPSQPPRPAPLPVVGCLKLTPEKGCSVVHQLAQRLEGRCRFLLVSGDPAVSDLFRGMRHVKVLPPQPGVDELLQRVCVVLAPSLWLEAWGMVVTDSLLRGIPVITSNTGALPEAGFGLCPVVPVHPITVPVCEGCGTPTWGARRYARQEVAAWVEAVGALLGDKGRYGEVARAGREEALGFVGQQGEELGRFFEWLNSLTPSAS